LGGGKVIAYLVEEEATTIIEELVNGKRGVHQNSSNHAMRSAIKNPCSAAALAFKKDITRAASLELNHLGQYDPEEGTRMAIMGAHRIVFAGVIAAVLQDFNLRRDNLDNLKSVIEELKVVVSEVGGLQCFKKSPEELDCVDSKATRLVKNLKPDALDVDALKKLLAMATAVKNGSDSIDLTGDANDDPPQQSPNQAPDSTQRVPGNKKQPASRRVNLISYLTKRASSSARRPACFLYLTTLGAERGGGSKTRYRHRGGNHCTGQPARG
jgi:hypothetical protein